MHDHGATTYPVVTPGDPGTFTISEIDFFMAGYWELKLDLLPTAGDRRRRHLRDLRPPVTPMAVGERDSDRINFDWLIRLRWAAIAGQLITIGAVHLAMQLAIPMAPLLALVARRDRQQPGVRAAGAPPAAAAGVAGRGDGAGRAAVLRPALPDRRSAEPVQLPVPDPDRARVDHDARGVDVGAGGAVARLLGGPVRDPPAAAARRQPRAAT